MAEGRLFIRGIRAVLKLLFWATGTRWFGTRAYFDQAIWRTHFCVTRTYVMNARFGVERQSTTDDPDVSGKTLLPSPACPLDRTCPPKRR